MVTELIEKMESLELRLAELEAKIIKSTPPGHYLSPAEVAKKYMVDKSTVHRLIKSGKLKNYGASKARIYEGDAARLWARRKTLTI